MASNLEVKLDGLKRGSVMWKDTSFHVEGVEAHYEN